MMEKWRKNDGKLWENDRKNRGKIMEKLKK